MKIAIVHDWLTNMGGAERIIKVFHEMFPEAPIFTIVYDKDRMPAAFTKMDIRTSFIQKMPFGIKKYRSYLPLMPLAVEKFDLSEYDIVLSSSTSCAKGVITGKNTLHICYCNTPMRYAWDMFEKYIEDKNIISKIIIKMLMKYIRKWDFENSERVDYFIANSNNVAQRIKRIYKRTSIVIYPPVNTEFFKPVKSEDDYYLIVSRLVPYKKVDLAIKVFNELKLPLIIIGDGPELENYRKISENNVKLLGKLSDNNIKDYYQRCKAFIFPGEEDFGITPLEAQACGKPVLAYNKGGALETVIQDVTGLFFNEQSVNSLKSAILNFEENGEVLFNNKDIIRENALKFGTDRFIFEIKKFIDKKYF